MAVDTMDAEEMEIEGTEEEVMVATVGVAGAGDFAFFSFPES